MPAHDHLRKKADRRQRRPLTAASALSPRRTTAASLANSALFDVRVAVEPPLQLGAGHAIEVSVNGQAVGQRFTASEFTIPPEFWGDVLPPANQRQQLDATIVDRYGAVLEQAAPVTFILRHVSGGYQRPWHGPGYRPGYAPRDTDQGRRHCQSKSHSRRRRSHLTRGRRNLSRRGCVSTTRRRSPGGISLAGCAETW
jgi:hypothetical protein